MTLKVEILKENIKIDVDNLHVENLKVSLRIRIKVSMFMEVLIIKIIFQTGAAFGKI